MICVYNPRPLKALPGGLNLTLNLGLGAGLALSMGLHALAILFFGWGMPSSEWSPAAGNRGSWNATEVALWARSEKKAGTFTQKHSRPASPVDEPAADSQPRSSAAQVSSHGPAMEKTKGSQGVGAGGSSTDYRSVLHALLDAKKTYPRVLRDLQLSGTVNVRFRVTREGLLKELEVLDAEAEGPLQAEALRFLRRVERVPLPPAELKDEELRFELPLRYGARG